MGRSFNLSHHPLNEQNQWAGDSLAPKVGTGWDIPSPHRNDSPVGPHTLVWCRPTDQHWLDPGAPDDPRCMGSRLQALHPYGSPWHPGFSPILTCHLQSSPTHDIGDRLSTRQGLQEICRWCSLQRNATRIADRAEQTIWKFLLQGSLPLLGGTKFYVFKCLNWMKLATCGKESPCHSFETLPLIISPGFCIFGTGRFLSQGL